VGAILILSLLASVCGARGCPCLDSPVLSCHRSGSLQRRIGFLIRRCLCLEMRGCWPVSET